MDVYLQSKEDGRVYVVRPRLLQDFLYAEYRLMDRALHSFENSDAERAVISAEGKKRTVVQQNRRDPGSAHWTDEASPQTRKELFRNWMARMLGLRVMEYVPPGKKEEGLKELVSIEYFGAGRPIGFLRLYKKESVLPSPPAPGAAPAADPGIGDYYAVTDNTRALVKLARPSGDEVARDIVNVMRD